MGKHFSLCKKNDPWGVKVVWYYYLAVDPLSHFLSWCNITQQQTQVNKQQFTTHIMAAKKKGTKKWIIKKPIIPRFIDQKPISKVGELGSRYPNMLF